MARGSRSFIAARATAHVKYWIKPDIENRIKNGEIKAYFTSRVAEITPDAVVVETPAGRETLRNDFVFAMTGYHPDFAFLERLGVRFEGPDRLPVCNPETLESNVPGIYLAGVIVAGSRTNEIFIENGRFHGRQIAASLTSKLKSEGRSAGRGCRKQSDRLRRRFSGGRTLRIRWWPRSIRWQMLAGLLLLEMLSIGLFAPCWSASRQMRALSRAKSRLAYEAASLALQSGEALEQNGPDG